jgi:hypothetical protein
MARGHAAWRIAAIAAAIALLAMLPLHAYVRPEGAWALVSTCDLAAIATAIGLLARSPVLVGTAFLFQLVVGMPALIIGIFTTYAWNITGIAIHVVPLTLGAFWYARDGLPLHAARNAWLCYIGSVVLAALLAPAHLNINFATIVWKPLQDTFPLLAFQAALVTLVGILLQLGELGLRRLSSRPVVAPTRPRGTG